MEQSGPYMLQGMVLFTSIAAIVFYYFHLHRGLWRYVSLRDLTEITKAVTLTILIFLPVLFIVNRLDGFPRSILFINWMVLLVLLGGPRFAYRMFRDRSLSLKVPLGDSAVKPIALLLVGINRNTELFLRQQHVGRSEYNVVGIVDHDPSRMGSDLYGVKVCGTIAGIGEVIASLQKKGKAPQKLLLTSDHTDKTVLKMLLEVADSYGLTLARLPKLTDFKEGAETKLQIRPVLVEDLLGRAQNALDLEGLRQMIAGKNILITGCGGTIGSELTRQIASFHPARITLVELSEYNLYMIDKELEENFSELPRKAVIADIRNRASLEVVFTENKPELVFHAAALKHVPLMEENPEEAATTNILGTRNIADCCLAHQVQAMVMISTDKAVNPTNIMGATKRVAESYIQALGNSSKNAMTKFITVRFGNVLGSSGSVIPLFQRQLERGGPLTVTHPDMERYFMTVREAVELVLQASYMGQLRPQKTAIFVLDMGEPVRIMDLAHQMIRMAGLRPEIDIKVIHTGLRPGEKLYEELFYEAEMPDKTEHESIMLATPYKVEIGVVIGLIETMIEAAGRRDKEASR